MSAGYTSVRAEASKLLQPASDASMGSPRGYISFHDRGPVRLGHRYTVEIDWSDSSTAASDLLHVRRLGSVRIALRKLV